MNVNGHPEQKIVILGAGPTGLGAAYRLQELGYRNWGILLRTQQLHRRLGDSLCSIQRGLHLPYWRPRHVLALQIL